MWLIYLMGAIFTIPILAIIGLNLYAMLTRRREIAFIEKGGYQATDPLLQRLNPEQSAIVYFTNDFCAPCKLMQCPQLDKLQSIHTDLTIITVDTIEQSDIAQRWQVMSVPRTVVIGKNHQVHTVNMDVTDANTLNQQLIDAESQITDDVTINKSDTSLFRLPKLAISRPQ
ncbi:MAG: thioredoxin family protein [Chloroflexota bacterium]